MNQESEIDQLIAEYKIIISNKGSDPNDIVDVFLKIVKTIQ